MYGPVQGVTMTPSGTRFLVLGVPGLAENRPSVMKGDALYVRRRGAPADGPEYEGFVHDVRLNEVGGACGDGRGDRGGGDGVKRCHASYPCASSFGCATEQECVWCDMIPVTH